MEWRNFLLRILQSCDWLVGFVASHSFHYCITVSCPVSGNLLQVLQSRSSHSLFSGYCSFKDVHYKLVMPNYGPIHKWCIFLKFLKVIFLLLRFEKLHNSLFCPFYFNILHQRHVSYAFVTLSLFSLGCTRWCSWLRHYATSQKFTGLIPDGVTGIFHWHNPIRTIMIQCYSMQ
jgi:hypothetical protein